MESNVSYDMDTYTREALATGKEGAGREKGVTSVKLCVTKLA